MELFWGYETELSAGVGFDMFGIWHILWILLMLLFIVAGGIWFVRQSIKGQRIFQVVLGCLMLLMELIQDIFLYKTGHLTINQLPLHLCGLAVFITAIKNGLEYYEEIKNRDKSWFAAYLGDVQYALCLPGALAAVLFPDWTAYPPFAFMSIVGFVNHGFIITSGIYSVLSADFKIHIRNFWRPLSFLMAVVPFMYMFDKAFTVNYMFLLWGPAGSPLEAIENLLGKWYLLGYGALVLAIIILWYLIGMIKNIIANRH